MNPDGKEIDDNVKRVMEQMGVRFGPIDTGFGPVNCFATMGEEPFMPIPEVPEDMLAKFAEIANYCVTAPRDGHKPYFQGMLLQCFMKANMAAKSLSGADAHTHFVAQLAYAVGMLYQWILLQPAEPLAAAHKKVKAGRESGNKKRKTGSFPEYLTKEMGEGWKDGAKWETNRPIIEEHAKQFFPPPLEKHEISSRVSNLRRLKCFRK